MWKGFECTKTQSIESRGDNNNSKTSVSESEPNCVICAIRRSKQLSLRAIRIGGTWVLLLILPSISLNIRTHIGMAPRVLLWAIRRAVWDISVYVCMCCVYTSWFALKYTHLAKTACRLDNCSICVSFFFLLIDEWLELRIDLYSSPVNPMLTTTYHGKVCRH